MRSLRAAFLIAVLLVLVASVAAVSAASPSPDPSAGTGDTRSAGEAPGFVGAPLVAIGAVLGLGALAGLGTIAYVRLTGGPGGASATAASTPGSVKPDDAQRASH